MMLFMLAIVVLGLLVYAALIWLPIVSLLVPLWLIWDNDMELWLQIILSLCLVTRCCRSGMGYAAGVPQG